jgi:hypothetical protein
MVAILTIATFGCQKRHHSGTPARTSPTDGVLDLDSIEPPIAQTLDRGQQNRIFRSILQAAQQNSCQANEAGAPQARLLTNAQYINSLSAILAINAGDAIGNSLLVEPETLGFHNLKGFNPMSPDRIKGLFQANAKIVERALERHQNWLDCGQDRPTCFRQFLQKKLPLLWRHEIAPEQINDLVQSFQNLGGDRQAFKLSLQRILISPLFLYRRELAGSGQLSPQEIASALAFSLWNEGPDQQLLARARNGELTGKEAIHQEIDRMMQDQRFWQGLDQFVASWLEVDKLANANKSNESFPGFNDQLKADLANEMTDFIFHLIQTETDGFDNLFNADFTVGTDNVAGFYGYQSLSTVQQRGQSLQKLQLPTDSQGLLGHPGFIASLTKDDKTHIASRGKRILGKIMCHLLEVPPNLETNSGADNVDPSLSERQKLTTLTSAGSCAGCHSFINGIGFGLESLDAVGKIRNQDDNFQAIDDTGILKSMHGETTAFTGVTELSRAVSNSADAQLCLTTQVFRHVYGRLETEADVCTITSVYQEAKAENLRLSDLYHRFLTQQNFLQRRQ